MRIASSGVTIETQGEFKEAEFGIGDPGLFLEYLRKTIYSNPKKAICQELMSNARDAHREVGTPDRPIRIKIPTRFNSTWECRDWGPGIDPDRMVKVFVQFGKSTKRGNGDENATDDGVLQTGGFGIGAKTPWAYTDSFMILTRSMEGKELVERSYVAIIAEDRKSKLMELDGAKRVIDPNDESIPLEDRQTGTTISLDVESQDQGDFLGYTMAVAKFWDVKPELVGSDEIPEWDNIETVYEGSNWRIINENRGSFYSPTPHAIVDGIPYPLNSSSIDNLEDRHRQILHAGIHIDFPVNSISLALSRESIQYDAPTQKAILSRLDIIHDELKDLIADKISNSKTLLDAKVAFVAARKMFGSSRAIVKDAPWTAPDGTVINVDADNIYKTDYSDQIIRFTVNGDRQSPVLNLKSMEVNAIHFEGDKSFCIVHKDEDVLSRLKLETLFDENPDIDKIYVLSRISVKDWNAKNHFQYLNVIPMSGVEKKKRAKNPNGGKTSVSKAFVYNNRWYSVSRDLSTSTDYYVEYYRDHQQSLPSHIFQMAVDMIGNTAEIIGVPTRFMKKIGPHMKPLKEEFVKMAKKDLEKFRKDNDLEEYLRVTALINKADMYDNLFIRCNNRTSVMKDCVNLLPDDSQFGTQMSKAIELLSYENTIGNSEVEKYKQIARFLGEDLFDGVKKPDDEEIMDFNTLLNEYPMLKLLGSGTFNWYESDDQRNKTLKTITDYITMVEEKNLVDIS